MGVSESKIISGKLSFACIKAEAQGCGNIDDLLSDDEKFTNTLRSLWQRMSPAHRKSIQKPTKLPRRSRAKPQPRNTNVLLKYSPQWEDDIKSFLEAGKQIQSNSYHPVADSYNFLSRLEEREEINLWHIRFLEVIFHHFLKDLCGSYKRSEDVRKAISIIRASGVVKDDAILIEKRVLSWGNVGRRLELLCFELKYNHHPDDEYIIDRIGDKKHLGLLFRLPGHVRDDYMKRLPLNSSSKRDLKVQELRSFDLSTDIQGISLDTLACDIFSSLSATFERPIIRESSSHESCTGDSHDISRNETTVAPSHTMEPGQENFGGNDPSEVYQQSDTRGLSPSSIEQETNDHERLNNSISNEWPNLQMTQESQVLRGLRSYIPPRPRVLHNEPLHCDSDPANLQLHMQQLPGHSLYNNQASTEHTMMFNAAQVGQPQADINMEAADLHPYMRQRLSYLVPEPLDHTCLGTRTILHGAVVTEESGESSDYFQRQEDHHSNLLPVTSTMNLNDGPGAGHWQPYDTSYLQI
ncbi:hypothetical protein BO94DRAFT_542089 [Aspergillus sclerotioniger CBS 115572]|uniref:Uncharacterized protein n=1 Tax=Aspergillus sclerotioniger CBS 115572 TaxID=1450535 RepID=A0A317XBW8_9EURO|nr:hypothetical protein BO94DRAFT_542089 [Aspergillus sclerotioniger CBS 115572]PWY96009.1 hypothetical protein BO94DRAFT_542089 [Aspergillus sclerotioniger CBS 115572]